MLKQASVPCVDHHLFLRRDYSDETGAEIPTLVTELRTAVEKMGYPVVVKNNHGQGGEGVYLVENEHQLVHRVTQMFTKYRGVAVSALFDAPYEYRLVVLQGRVLLCFKKIRAKIEGDGKSTLAELAFGPGGPMALIADNKKESWLLQMEDKAHQVIPAGEAAPLEWRHNLAFGAQPEVITPDNILYTTLADIAIRAAKAINLGFCTVDILQSLSGELKVLEVNSGVSVEKFAEALGEEGAAIAKGVYQAALKALVE
jgi:glutathione synthase/RimK-type ligase-like ATP-grasp enzyme